MNSKNYCIFLALTTLTLLLIVPGYNLVSAKQSIIGNYSDGYEDGKEVGEQDSENGYSGDGTCPGNDRGTAYCAGYKVGYFIGYEATEITD